VIFPITTDVRLSFIIKEKAKLKNRLKHKKITNTGMMSPSFPPGGRESTLSSEDSSHEASQSGHSGGCDSGTNASHRDQGGGSGTGLRVRSIKDGSLIKAPIAD